MAGLESLPERMTALESQIVQLRGEMRAEFSAIRAEMHLGDGELRADLRKEIRTLKEEIREEVAGLGTHMRVLHEDLVSKIGLIQEGRRNSPRPRR